MLIAVDNKLPPPQIHIHIHASMREAAQEAALIAVAAIFAFAIFLREQIRHLETDSGQ